MTMLATVVALTALMGAATAAYAATTAADIAAINAGKHSVTLNNGKTFTAPKGAQLNTFTLGQRVRVAYATQNGANHATRIAALDWRDASLGG